MRQWEQEKGKDNKQMWGRIEKCARKAVTDREMKNSSSLHIMAGYRYRVWKLIHINYKCNTHNINSKISYKSGRIHSDMTQGVERQNVLLQVVDKLNTTDSVLFEVGIVLFWPKGTTLTVCKLKLELCCFGQRAQHRQCVSWNWNCVVLVKGHNTDSV